MTQLEVAKVTGISYSMLNKYERNMAGPRDET